MEQRLEASGAFGTLSGPNEMTFHLHFYSALQVVLKLGEGQGTLLDNLAKPQTIL